MLRKECMTEISIRRDIQTVIQRSSGAKIAKNAILHQIVFRANRHLRVGNMELMLHRIGSVLTGGAAMSDYIRLRDLTRKERRILNRIVRRQRKEVKRK